jgi:hypothetical protein
MHCRTVLQGIARPSECRAYGDKCTPEHPLGAPMVSSEGACSAYFRYQNPETIIWNRVAHHHLTSTTNRSGTRRRRKLSDRLIHDVIIRELGDVYTDSSHDGALIEIWAKRHSPPTHLLSARLFFPGGDIGRPCRKRNCKRSGLLRGPAICTFPFH